MIMSVEEAHFASPLKSVRLPLELDHPVSEDDDKENGDQDRALERDQCPDDGTTHEVLQLMELTRASSGFLALLFTLGICISMVLCSFVMLHQLSRRIRKVQQPEPRTRVPPVQNHDSCGETMTRVVPTWLAMLEGEIDVIQNLIHASLLGAAAVVTAVRGDSVWFLFCRNVSFFFTPLALSYVCTDGYLLFIKKSKGNPDLSVLIRWIAALGLFITSICALVCLQLTYLRLRREVRTLERHHSSGSTSLLAQTSQEKRLGQIIYYATWIVQGTALVYVLSTTYQWFDIQESCSLATEAAKLPGENFSPSGSIMALEVSYSLGAHQSYMLALFMLAAIYPRDSASVGGAFLASIWRLVVASGSFIRAHVSRSDAGQSQIRSDWSLFYIQLEILAMVSIAGASLALWSIGSFLPTSSRAGYKEVYQPSDDDFSASNEEGIKQQEIEEEIPLIDSLTLFEIAASTRFNQQQRRGAFILGWSSAALLVEMSLESFLMLSQTFVGTNEAHEIYKWGMHACSIYAFCVVMSVEAPSIFIRARVLLGFACPVGSFVALWQLSSICKGVISTYDPWTTTVGCLFLGRAIIGLIQTSGLLLLNDVIAQPLTNSTRQTEMTTKYDALVSSRGRARWALYAVYLPCTIAYIFTWALHGNCYEPMVSPSIPRRATCEVALHQDAQLGQNWIGLDLLFHFGMLTTIFASVGLSTGLYYRPSLTIASLFARHGAFSILVHFLWDAIQTSLWREISIRQLGVRCLLLTWGLSTLYLAVCLHRFRYNRTVRW